MPSPSRPSPCGWAPSGSAEPRDDGATFCAWWERAGSAWRCGELEFSELDEYESDGADFLLGSLSTERFEDNYGWEPELLQAVVETHAPLEMERLRTLAPEADVGQVLELMRQVGYGQAFPSAEEIRYGRIGDKGQPQQRTVPITRAASPPGRLGRWARRIL